MISSSIGSAFYRIADSKLQVHEFTIEPRTTTDSHSATNASHTDLLTEAANAIQAIPQNLAAFSKEWRSQWRPRQHRASLYLSSKDELLKLPASRVKFSAPREVARLHSNDQRFKGSHFWPTSLFDGFPSHFVLWTNDMVMVMSILPPCSSRYSLKNFQLYPFRDNSAFSNELSFRPDVGDITSVDGIETDIKRILVSGSVSSPVYIQISISECTTDCLYSLANRFR